MATHFVGMFKSRTTGMKLEYCLDESFGIMSRVDVSLQPVDDFSHIQCPFLLNGSTGLDAIFQEVGAQINQEYSPR